MKKQIEEIEEIFRKNVDNWYERSLGSILDGIRLTASERESVLEIVDNIEKEVLEVIKEKK